MAVQRTFEAQKRSCRNASTGRKYFYIVITVITFMDCSSEKSAIDRQVGMSYLGHHCEEEPRCLCFSEWGEKNSAVLCEDKVLVHRTMRYRNPVYYQLECKDETEADPYYYLSMILFANFSAHSIEFANTAELAVINCTAPSRGQSVLLGGGSKGGIGGWRNLPLEVLEVICTESNTFQLSKQIWRDLNNLKILKVTCPKLSKVDADLFSGISQRLERLEISETEVQILPENIFPDSTIFPDLSLNQLILRRNKLRSFRRCLLSSLWNLELLDLGENEIESLDDDIFLKTKLMIKLYLEENSLSTLPTSLFSLQKLQLLRAEFNRISFIPQEFLYSLSCLREVYLQGNKIVTLGLASQRITPTYNRDGFIKEFGAEEMLPNSSLMLAQSGNLNNISIATSSIRLLNLSNNFLSSLPHEAFFGMQELRYLDISCNRLTYLPDDIISRNEKLLELKASNNLFTDMPATLLRSNTNLELLDLSHNFIETLDLDFFRNSTRVNYIYINNNRIRNLPDKIFQPFRTQKKEFSRNDLDMSRNLLENLPDLTLPNLTNLSLSENNLTFIAPDMLAKVPSLMQVNLSHNLIHTIGMQTTMELHADEDVLFGKHLNNLEVIDLSSNRLTILPSISFVLKTLKHLNVSSNCITDLEYKPEKRLRDEVILQTFDVSRNHLKSVKFFSHRLWEFLTTRHLDLSHNMIHLVECTDYFHSSRMVWGCLSPLHSLSGLEIIILSHNLIAYIPMEFQHYLPDLRFVDLSYNKIKRLWYGDLLFTRALEAMDIEMFVSYQKKGGNHHRLSADEIMHEKTFRRYPGSKNLTIDLRHNSIDSLQLPDEKIGVVYPGCDVDSHFASVKLLLGHNPIVCGCDIFKLLRYSAKEIRPMSTLERLSGLRLVMPAAIDIQDLHCSKPDSVNGKAVAEVDTWAYLWLPMIGFCTNHAGVQSTSGRLKTATNVTKPEALGEPPT
ncbi:chaoptin-like [Ischnura elegans]|uniref:chaoptin-like n=1 Tax=Ischnura elegans TaxID=197161 RepID=UPI001ED8B649|nr:chaoptin-like [Ischnura elegans]